MTAPTEWETRLQSVVLPALTAGLFVYVAHGVLEPGPGIGSHYYPMDRPTQFPRWQIYLGAKGSGQPAIRYMQLIHKPRNPEGGAWQNYRVGVGNFDGLGVPMVLPLGEGMEASKAEYTLAQELQATILNIPVRVIGLGRTRRYHSNDSKPYVEPVIMEVYSEDGRLVWKNPFAPSLEAALAHLSGGDILRPPVIPGMPVPAPAPVVVPHPSVAKPVMSQARTTAAPRHQPATPAPLPAATKTPKEAAEAQFVLLTQQGMQEESEIVAQVSQTLGTHPELTKRLFAIWARTNPLNSGSTALRDAITQARTYGFEGEDLIESVAAMTGVAPEQIQQVLQAEKRVPEPAKPMAPADRPADRRPIARLDTASDLVSALAIPVPQEAGEVHVTEGVKGASKPTKLKARPAIQANDPVSLMCQKIQDNQAEYQAAIINHLQAGIDTKLGAGEIRQLLNIPKGSTHTDGMKRVADALRRTILDPMVASHMLVREGNHPRSIVYRLAEG